MLAENTDEAEYIVAKISQLLWASDQWDQAGKIVAILLWL